MTITRTRGHDPTSPTVPATTGQWLFVDGGYTILIGRWLEHFDFDGNSLAVRRPGSPR